MAGGVALNCVANGRLLREGPFENIWIQPAAGDAGGALGARAAGLASRTRNQPRQPQSPTRRRARCSDRRSTNDDIGLFLDSMGATYERIADEDGRCSIAWRVCWPRRRSSAGFRDGWSSDRVRSAAAASSATPRSPRMQQKMNVKIKFRESFRPFAPCVLREHVDEYFEMRPGEDSPYMLHGRARARAVAHGARATTIAPRMAGSRSRVRVVGAAVHSAGDHPRRLLGAQCRRSTQQRHGRYYRLMKRFHALTGCPGHRQYQLQHPR